MKNDARQNWWFDDLGQIERKRICKLELAKSKSWGKLKETNGWFIRANGHANLGEMILEWATWNIKR